jgi:murein DD-endopeptidase MepM/ murein hydrolase activator NlpD
MASNKKSKKEKKRLIHRLRNKYRLLVINETTYDERLSMLLSPLNVISMIGLIVFIVAGITILTIVYSPMKEWIPGYPSDQIRRQAYHAANLADSLEIVVNKYERYNNNIKLLLRGEVPRDSFLLDQGGVVNIENIQFSKSTEDSLLRERFEKEERYNIILNNLQNEKVLKETILFFPPMRGEISGEFDLETGHLGVDITGDEDEPIMAALEGTIIFAAWTSETGYVIELMHPNNLLTIYKHNSILLGKVGDRVTAGQPIAIIGNTGELTTGPHLHFELWNEGHPLNPIDYISFNK